jgi:outer membrane biosynthesis protein TonB
MSESIEDTAPVAEEEVKKEEPVDEKDGEPLPDAAEDQVKHMLEEVNRERIENKITARDNAAAGSSTPPQQEGEASAATTATTADDGEKPSPRNIRKNALMERWVCLGFDHR